MKPLLPTDARIVTERLVMRPLVTGDAEAIFPLFANWNVVRYLSTPPWPYARDDARTFVDAVIDGADDDREQAFAILLNGALIGLVSLRMRLPGDLQRGAGPNIGYWLGEPYWGRGHMTEAARGFVAAIFAAYGGDSIYSGAFTENVASLRVQEKIGFTIDGETTLFSRPRNAAFPHTNTVLTRARFRALAR